MNLDNYTAKVYVDCIEGWQECEVINLSNYRATVKTKFETQLNRIVKITENKDLKEDGCVYFIKKNKPTWG